jgi:hypothetical protein
MDLMVNLLETQGISVLVANFLQPNHSIISLVVDLLEVGT